MRNKPSLGTLLFPHLRQRVLATFLLHPKAEWYLSELVRHLQCAPAHLHRELGLLVDAGVLVRRVEGRQVYYSPDPRCPVLPELTGLVRKTMGLPAILSEALRSVRSKIQCACVYGSVARGEEESGSDIDLLVVGDVTVSELLPALAKAERKTGRPVNPTVYPARELAEKIRRRNHFLAALLADPTKIFVIGAPDDLEAIAAGGATQAPSDEQNGARRTARRRRG